MFLQINHLSVAYPKSTSPAVRDLNLTLAMGEIGVLIGPSGCGKTTVLRSIAGLEKIDAGKIVVNNTVVSEHSNKQNIHLAPEKRHIGMVFQDYALFPHLNVEKNIAFGLFNRNVDIRKKRVTELLDWIGLSHARHLYPHQLSGGQQQRVALARAVAPQPALLLLDEPFSSLDVDLREQLAQALREMLRAINSTALIVTHDQLEAFALGDKVGVMQAGELHQWAPPYTLYHEPNTRFVADFIGHGVFLPGHVVLHHENATCHKHVVTALGELHGLSSEVLESLPLGECDILLRADDIIVANEADPSSTLATIVAKAFRGAEFLYKLRLPSGEEVLALLPSHINRDIGELLAIKAQAQHVVTFPREPL